MGAVSAAIGPTRMEIEMRSFEIAAAAALLLFTAAPAMAANFEVHMLNKGEAGLMVFEPAVTKIAVGDSVTFIAVDKGHNAQSIEDILPAGGETFKGAPSEDITVTFTVPGIYGVKCMPHFSMGMVAAVIVGDTPANLDQVATAKLPGKARQRLEAALAAAQ